MLKLGFSSEQHHVCGACMDFLMYWEGKRFLWYMAMVMSREGTMGDNEKHLLDEMACKLRCKGPVQVSLRGRALRMCGCKGSRKLSQFEKVRRV